MTMKLPGPKMTALLIVLLMGGYFAMGTLTHREEKISEQTQDKLFRVVVSTLQAEPLDNKLPVNGRTAGFKSVSVLAETAGQVRAVLILEGDRVRQGDPLCQLDVGARQSQLDQALALQNKAALDLKAARTLYAKGFQSEAAVNAAEAAFDQARALVDAARQERERTRITAPFDGIVTKVFVETGDLVQPGMPCASLVNLDPILFETDLSQQEVGMVEKGAKAQLLIDGMAPIDGVVRFVWAAATPGANSFHAELSFANPDSRLRDGLSATAEISIGQQKLLTIPRSAILFNDEGIEGIHIVENIKNNVGIVRFVPIVLVRDDENGAYIVSPADEVNLIIRGKDFVIPGQQVEVADPASTYFGG